MGFESIFDASSRHNSYGRRVTKVTKNQPSYCRLVEQEVTSFSKCKKDVETYPRSLYND